MVTAPPAAPFALKGTARSIATWTAGGSRGGAGASGWGAGGGGFERSWRKPGPDPNQRGDGFRVYLESSSLKQVEVMYIKSCKSMNSGSVYTLCIKLNLFTWSLRV